MIYGFKRYGALRIVYLVHDAERAQSFVIQHGSRASCWDAKARQLLDLEIWAHGPTYGLVLILFLGMVQVKANSS